MTIESAWELQARPQAGAAAAGRAEGGGGAESDALMPLASSSVSPGGHFREGSRQLPPSRTSALSSKARPPRPSG